MQPARRVIATGSVVSGVNPTTLSLPAGWQEGDVALLATFVNTPTTLTTPTGWTALQVAAGSGGAPSDTTGWLYTKMLVAGEADPVTNFGAASDGAYVIAVYSEATGVDTSLATGTLGPGTAQEAGNLATTGPNRMIVTIASEDLPGVQANNWTAFAGYSIWSQFEGSGNQNTGIADKLEPAAGTFSPDWTSVASDAALVFLLSLAPPRSYAPTRMPLAV